MPTNFSTSQTTPDKFYQQPKKQRKNLRQLIKNASPEEVDAFLQDDILPKAAYQPKHLLLLLLDAVVFALAILFDSTPLLLFVVLSSPFAAQVLNISLSAVVPSFKLFWRGLLGTLVTALFYFGSGLKAAKMARNQGSSLGIPLRYLGEQDILGAVILAVGVVLFAWHCLSQKELPRLSSALITGLVFLRFGFVGWVARGSLELAWEAFLIYCLPYLALTLLISSLTFWVAGLPPRHAKGWLIFFLVVALFAGSIVGFIAYGPYLSRNISYRQYGPAYSSEMTATEPVPTLKPSQTRAVASPTAAVKPSNTPTLMPTATSTPTPVLALVNSEVGVRMRAEADPNAEVLAYLNNLTEVELLGEEKIIGNTLWQKVRAPDGKIGWIVGQYLITATPTP
ncbi:MAG TPA: SH3 domain-containing protein [Anaerolineaceae bacterium]|nr:SH3 domain-containing protein [Anaerolineaceae bacterium]